MNPIFLPNQLAFCLGVVAEMVKKEVEVTNDALEQVENPELPVSVVEDAVATAENQHVLGNTVKFGH